jgi:2-polyprenyl-3-methyl-5-hydroxy-6-metoxy-1,4-benzoquinol methylase
MEIIGRIENPEIDQDRIEDLIDNYRKYGYTMFPQQRRIYRHIVKQLALYKSIANFRPSIGWGQIVLEVGCGNGVGSATLERESAEFIATDKLQANIDFAGCLYPWIKFQIWDINLPRLTITTRKADVVVAVEVLEHVADPQAAMNNLIDAAIDVVWVSTPNGLNKKQPPENPYHVGEYSPMEITSLVGGRNIQILDWETMKEVGVDTKCDPLLYKIKVER